MRKRGPFNGAAQKKALRALLHWEDGGLKTTAGRSLDELASSLKMSRTTLDRYLGGQQPLCSDQFAPFAQQLGITETTLIRMCFPAVVAEPTPVKGTVALEAELQRLFGEDAERANRVADVVAPMSPHDQRIMLELVALVLTDPGDSQHQRGA